MLLKILKTNLIIFLGIYVTGILSEQILKNQIDTNLQENNGNELSTKKFNSSTAKTITLTELFPGFFFESERKIRNTEPNEISNTLHSLYSEERDSHIGYDSIRGNRVKRHKCPEDCQCKKFNSIKADEDIILRIKRDNSYTEIPAQTETEIDSVDRQTDATTEQFKPHFVTDQDVRDHVQEEYPKTKTSDSEYVCDLDHLETIHRPQIEIDPFHRNKCLENCINLNNVEFDGDSYLILKSENLEQAKKEEKRRKREEDCKFCIIKGLIELSKSLNRNPNTIEAPVKKQKKQKKSKCSRKKSVKNKYARRQARFESILRKFEPKTCRQRKRRTE